MPQPHPWDEDRMEPDVDAACAMIREVEPALAFGRTIGFLVPHSTTRDGGCRP